MATQAQAAAHDYAAGDIVSFLKYASELPEGQEPLFSAGDRCMIESVNEDTSMVALPVSDDDKQIKGRQGDTVFPDEVELVKAHTNGADPEVTEAKTATRTAAKKKAPAKKASTTKAPAKKAKARTRSATAKTEAKTARADKRAKAQAKSDAKSVRVAKKAQAKKAKADKVKAKAAKAEAAKMVIKHDAEVKELLAGKGGALAAAKALVADVDNTYYSLGGVLHEISEKNAHVKAGYEAGLKGFQAYVEAELGTDYRKARYLVAIYTKFRALNISRKRLAQIQWSKAKELARLELDDLRDNFDELVEYASNNTRDDLISHIKSTYVVANRDGAERVHKVKMVFVMVGDAATMVERALGEAKDAIGDADQAKCLEHICGEWLNMSEGVPGQFEDVAALIAHAEKEFGATLTQVDSE